MLNSELWQVPPAGGADLYDHQIAKSARFQLANSSYMHRTPSSAGNRRTWTYSTWVKRTKFNINNSFFGATRSGYENVFRFEDSDGVDRLNLFGFTGSGLDFNLKTTGSFRDSSAWYHIVVAMDTTQGTSSNRLKLYVNGELQTDFTTSTYPDQNYDTNVNDTNTQTQVGYGSYGGQYFDGYIAESVLIDGTQYAASDFGETKNGVWIPKDPSGLTFGTNGFHMNYASSSALGNDVSGNNNDLTVSGLATHDQMLDTPTFGSDSGGNFCTLNPLSPTTNGAVYTEGNLKVSPASNWSTTTYIKGTMHIPRDKKIYFEASDAGSNGGLFAVGIARETGVPSSTNVGGAGSVTIYDDSKYVNGTQTSSFVTQASTGDIIQVAVDGSNGKVWLGINNTWAGSGDPAAGSNQAGIVTSFATEHLFPVVAQNSASNLVMNFGQDSSFAGAKTAQGNGGDNEDFTYTPPTDFVALSTANLTVADAVDPAQTEDNIPTKLFNPVLYTGDGGSSTAITGVGFKPDWVWIKRRNAAENHNLYDSSRGANKRIQSNRNVAETTEGLPAFGSDGFTVDASGGINNVSSQTYVAWNWRANGSTTSTNTSGSVNSTVQADPSGAFSIVTWAGGGGSATLGHGLSGAPTFMVAKSRTSGATVMDWPAFHKNMNNGAYPANESRLYLDSTGDYGTGALWQNDNNSATVFGVSSNINNSSKNYVAYCFTDVEGYCKAGYFEGNGSTDGPYLYTGFRPSIVMRKRVDGSGSWLVKDDARNPINDASIEVLTWNDSGAENAQAETSDGIDFLSNGFKLKATNNGSNGSTLDYVYLAISFNPFQYSTAF